MTFRFTPTTLHLLLGLCCLHAALIAQSVPIDTLPDQLSIDLIPDGLETARFVPDDNSLTPARVTLGRKLFFDPILSADRKVACASCHDPAHGFATRDPVAIGIGQSKGERNAPSILNRAYGRTYFWDGRADSLEAQALKPIASPVELGSSVDEALRRLRADADYAAQFVAAYPDGVTAENLARAIACFERVLLSGDSPVDRFQSGDAEALTDGQRQGLWVFEGKGRCWKCHANANYTDEQFHNTGVAWGREPLDLGRFRVTQREEDRGRFKTPTLRDVARTAPYMHDGSLETLRNVVEFYNRGGGMNSHLDATMQPLGLSVSEVGFLVEFLEALSPVRIPKSPPQ